MLDMECFSFLNRALESEAAPVVILATNRGITNIRGTNYKGPHGMPLDLLDRLLIIQTKNYTESEIRQIIETRCEQEDVQLNEDALELLTTIGKNTTLRYAIQLITTSSLIASKRKTNEVEVVDVRRAYSMFLDVKRSSDYLRDHQLEYLFSEEATEKMVAE